MSIKYEFLTLEEDDGVIRVNVNRPDKLNALNRGVLEDLKTCYEDLSKKSLKDLKGVILCGAGDKAFIAGADIKEMSGMTTEEANAFGRFGQEVSLAIENCRHTTIACVNGFALGGGCEMAMSHDLLLATENAVFGQPEVKLGLIPGFGGTQRLARLIGRQKAKEIIYTGRNVDANEALELGLVLKLFKSKDEMIKHAKELLIKISKNSPLAVSEAKFAIQEGVDKSIEEGLAVEVRHFSGIFASHDMKEGTTAFVEKRKAQFKGE